MIRLSTIGQIGITVRDVARAVEFYRSKLGIPLLFETRNMAFFECGEVRLMLGTPEANQQASGAIVYFKESDIDAAAAELESRGVAFDRDPHLVAHMPDHDLWMAFFRDPDQNILALMCEKR